MPVLIHDCPYCGADHVGFDFVVSRPAGLFGQDTFNTMFVCNACGRAVVAFVKTRGNPIEGIPGNLRNPAYIESIEVVPKSAVASCPEHCSPDVSKAFIQAEENIFRDNPEAAASMDRRALEIGTKLIAPDLANDNLWNRIEKLAEKHLITPSLKEWAHKLRIFGNEALHDIDGVTLEEAKQAHELTRFMLIYLFTLPEQVRLSKEANSNTPIT